MTALIQDEASVRIFLKTFSQEIIKWAESKEPIAKNFPTPTVILARGGPVLGKPVMWGMVLAITGDPKFAEVFREDVNAWVNQSQERLDAWRQSQQGKENVSE